MKKSRQQRILELISQYEIETQEELAEKLREDGFDVTQATVSRDIREMQLSKIAISNGGQKYIRPVSGSNELSEKYIRVLKEGMLSAQTAGNLIVIRTVTGMAMAVATALDGLEFKEMLGCIAGDDTIFCAIRTAGEAESVKEKILECL